MEIGNCLRGGHFRPLREAALRALSILMAMDGYLQESVSTVSPAPEFVMCLEVAVGDKGSWHTHTRIWSGET